MSAGQFIKGQKPWNAGLVGVQTSWAKGKKFSLEYRKKLSVAHKGKSTGRFNELSPGWKGDKVTYSGLHKYIYRKLGKPNYCEFCNKYFTGKKIQWANKSHEYKRDLSDWLRLCTACHKKYDLNYKKEINNVRC